MHRQLLGQNDLMMAVYELFGADYFISLSQFGVFRAHEDYAHLM
jgi:hypothetical protein